MKRFALCLAVLAAWALPTAAQEPYKVPPQAVIDILDAPPAPGAVLAPTRDALLLVDYDAYPSIELLARPFLKLAGTRVDPKLQATQRTRQYTGLSVTRFSDGSTRRISLPAQAKIQPPVWSADGKRFAFLRDLDDGVELWVGNVASGEAHRLTDLRLNDVLGNAFEWMPDSRHLLVRTVPAGRGTPPVESPVPIGPRVQETAGKQSRMATYQDLLEDDHDGDLFEHFATSQLEMIDVETGTHTAVGEPGLYLGNTPSFDGHFLLMTRLERPFSRRVPYDYFARSLEIWRPDGSMVGRVARLPVSDEVPQQGVPTGPRNAQWQPLVAPTVVWVEALDGGDPRAKVEHRDRLMALPVDKMQSRETARLKDRYTSLRWLAEPQHALLTEYDRDRRWTRTSIVDLGERPAAPRTIFDLSAQDAYKDPGTPVVEKRTDGQPIVVQSGKSIYLAGRGASEEGDRPFLDRLNLESLKKERLFASDPKSLESFVAFGPGTDRKRILTSHQSPTSPPNYFHVDLGSKRRTARTTFPDPAPQFAGVSKQLLKYRRADGVALSGMLYLPPGYRQGERLPLVLWAYPLEFSDAGTAGQIRGSANAFTRPTNASQIFFVTQGYAVLDNATMPVIGDPETMNDTYIEQIVAAAKAAIDTLDGLGIADRDRVCVGGHSYGAFMTANLLAHSDLFAAGIGRSGAYNRSLTPFGFQAERRSYWEATDVYTRISPFTHADDIHAPLLLIHGEEDNNSGTFPIQSERLFQAIQGNGGTARLVLLPSEAHGYRARESILTVLAEMFEWSDRYVKNRTPRTP